jgi:hypothetical protein
MKEQKPLGLGPSEQRRSGLTEDKNGTAGGVEQKPPRSALPEQRPARPEATMHSQTQTRKPRGRLGREVLGKLGKTLEAYYDEVRKEGVPDRFKDLLEQYDKSKANNDKEPG